MSSADSNRRAAPVKIEHTARSVDALEWSTPGSVSTIVVAVDSDVANLIGPVAEKLMDRFRVIGISLKAKMDPVTVSWWATDPVILLAQGKAGETACETARLAPGAIKALVLADYAPPVDEDTSPLAVPVLLFTGRESSSESHEAAVAAHSHMRGSKLIELDGCADQPTKNCPTALAESLTWYLEELGKPYMEFSDFSGSDTEPVDPKG